MKTITVISDSHGNREAFEKLARVFDECDYIIHLGDTSADGSFLRKKYPLKTYVVNGNCELTKLGEDELKIQIEGVRIFACHGHMFGVKRQLDNLAYAAEQAGAQIALYGHTHDAREDVIGGVTLFNPGTLSRYSANTYLYLVINGEKFTGKIVEM